MTGQTNVPGSRPAKNGGRPWGEFRSPRIAFAVLGPVLTVTLFVVIYYVLPLDRPMTPRVGLALALGLALFTALVVWQVRAIRSSRYPRWRAVQALAVSLPLFLLLFAVTYYLMRRSDPSSFNTTLTRTDALYFTVTVFATVGFGDIVAHSETARILVTVQMLGDLLFLGFGIHVIFQAVREGLQGEPVSRLPGGRP